MWQFAPVFIAACAGLLCLNAIFGPLNSQTIVRSNH